VDDIVDRLFQQNETDRTFLARLGQTVDQLPPIERLMGTITLDHAEIGALNFLIGGITISAFQTFAAASNAEAFPGLARIDHLIIPRPALCTTHSVGALSITQQVVASMRETHIPQIRFGERTQPQT